MLTPQNFWWYFELFPTKWRIKNRGGYITPAIISIIDFDFLCRLIQSVVLNFLFRSISFVIVVDLFLTYIICLNVIFDFNSMIITCRYFVISSSSSKSDNSDSWNGSRINCTACSTLHLFLLILKSLKVSANKK